MLRNMPQLRSSLDGPERNELLTYVIGNVRRRSVEAFPNGTNVTFFSAPSLVRIILPWSATTGLSNGLNGIVSFVSWTGSNPNSFHLAPAGKASS